MAETPIIEHYEINVGSKPRDAAVNTPYLHVARIVLPAWMNRDQAEQEYLVWTKDLVLRNDYSLYKTTLYGVAPHTSYKILP